LQHCERPLFTERVAVGRRHLEPLWDTGVK